MWTSWPSRSDTTSFSGLVGSAAAAFLKTRAGRKAKRTYLAGKGDVIVTLGFEVGNALCDAIETRPVFRHVKHLLTEGRLDVSLPLTSSMLGSLVGQNIAEGVAFTQAHADALLALAEVDAPVTWLECQNAMEGA